MKRGIIHVKMLGLACALFVSLSVPQLHAQEGTEGQPSPQTPQQPPELEVSESELEQFAAAIRNVQDIQLEVQEHLRELIADSELDQQRFQEIHAASLNPQIQMPEDVSDAEEAAYDELLHELVNLEHEAQQRMQTVVRDAGLEVMRFNEIATAIQQDDELYAAMEDLID